MTNSQKLKNKYFILILIATISINLIVGMYFIVFEKDILESLFHSTLPFSILCLCDGILIFSLCVMAFRQSGFQTLLSPNTEERGFIFMDLNNSTAIAEELGHQQYSNFLRDTFSTLEQLIEKVDGLEIYQYVGDEAVLSWELYNEKVNRMILCLLPQFQLLLREKRKYFKNKYDFHPSFKCAIHGGYVTKTFLGKDRKQTAFHGDVLNTTARVLGLCHQYHTCALISEYIYQRVKHSTLNREFEKLEAVNIQGKTKKVSLFKMNCSNFNSLFQSKRAHFYFN